MSGDLGRRLWRDIDQCARRIILERGPGRLTKAARISFQPLKHSDEEIIRDEPLVLAHAAVAKLKRIAIERDLLGRRRIQAVGKKIGLKQLILRRDNVFDLGTAAILNDWAVSNFLVSAESAF